jgi:hypothetical protein
MTIQFFWLQVENDFVLQTLLLTVMMKKKERGMKKIFSTLKKAPA